MTSKNSTAIFIFYVLVFRPPERLTLALVITLLLKNWMIWKKKKVKARKGDCKETNGRNGKEKEGGCEQEALLDGRRTSHTQRL